MREALDDGRTRGRHRDHAARHVLPQQRLRPAARGGADGASATAPRSAWAERAGDGPAAIHSVRAVPARPAARLPRRGRRCTSTCPSSRTRTPTAWRRTACTPTRLLHDEGLLGPGTTVVHATHLTDDDIALLGSTRTHVCITPTTERDLADGIGPARRLPTPAARSRIGSDSHAVIDPFEELRGLETSERLATQRARPLDRGRAARRSARPGRRIAVGEPADLVTIDTGTPRTAGTGADEHTAVFAATGRRRHARRRRWPRRLRPGTSTRRWTKGSGASSTSGRRPVDMRAGATTLITDIGELVTNDPEGPLAIEDAALVRRRRARSLDRPGRRRTGRRRADRRRRPRGAPRLRRHPLPPGLRRRPGAGVRGPHGRRAVRRRRHPHHGRGHPRRDRRAADAATSPGWSPRCAARAPRPSRSRAATASPSATRPARWRSPGSSPTETTFLGAHVVPPEYADDPGGVRRPGDRPDAGGLRRRTPAGSTCSASAAPSTPTRRARSSPPARRHGLRGRLHANQLGPGPGVRLAAELGLAAVDHCTYLYRRRRRRARATAAPSRRCCRASSSPTRQPYPDARRLLDAGVRGRAGQRLQPRLVLHQLDAVLHRAGRPRDGDDARPRPCTPRRPAAPGRWTATTSAPWRPGARADLVVLDAPSHVHLAYRPGVPLVARRPGSAAGRASPEGTSS